MAALATLTWLNLAFINADDASNIRGTLALLAGDPHNNYGWHIEKWVPSVAEIEKDGSVGPVTEKITCLVNAANKSDLEDEFANLELMANVARMGARDTSSCSVVYLAMYPNGSQQINAYIHNINYDILEPITESCGYIENNMARVKLNIVREPFWEELSYTANVAVITITDASSMIDYRVGGTDIECDAPARMTSFGLVPYIVGNEVDRAWIGLRTELHCPSPSEFVPVWELEDGTNNPAESGITDDVDATASSAARVTVSETDLDWDNTWHETLEIIISDIIGANRYRAQFGLFKWLLRAKVTSGEWQTQLRFGYRYMSDDDFAENNIVTIDNSNWDFFDMGQQPIPFCDSRIYWPDNALELINSEAEEFTVQVWARRTSGTGNLYLDCLCPIPIDEGFLFIEGASATSEGHGAGDTDSIIYRESPYRTADCVVYRSFDMRRKIQFNADRFNFLPQCEGYIVVAFARSDQSDLTEECAVGLKYARRWRIIRGT
jgi:hypothetical protein